MIAVVVLLLLVSGAALAIAVLRTGRRDESRGAAREPVSATIPDSAAAQLHEQAAELEQQVEEAQRLAEELELANVELGVALEGAEASEARFRRMFSESPLPMWIYDPQTLGFLDVNAAAIASYGFTREEFLASTLLDIRPADEVPRLQDLFRTQEVVGQLMRGSYRHRHKDGTVRDVEITAQDTDVDGRVARLVVVFDVTEQHRVTDREHFLAEAGRLLGKSHDVNEAFGSIVRLAVPRLADWCAIDLLDEQGRLRQSVRASVETEAAARWAALSDGGERRHPVPIDAPNGPGEVTRSGVTLYHPVLSATTGATLWPDGGALEARSLIVVPLTARGRARGALTLLSATGRRYESADCAMVEEIGRHAGLSIENAERAADERASRSMADAAADRMMRLQSVTAELSATLTAAQVARVIVQHGVAAVGGHAGSVSAVNEQTGTLVLLDATGYTPDMLDPFREMPLDGTLPLTDAVRTGEPIVIETWAECLTRYPALGNIFATNRSVAIAAMPLMVDGRRIGALGVTFAADSVLGAAERSFLMAIAQQCAQALERARLHEAEERARTAAEAANRAKSDFLATMSHELRTPLNAIAGFSQLLQDGIYGPLNDEQQGVIRRVDRAQRHLLGLINDVLNYAKLEAGKVQFDVRETDIAEIIGEAAAIGEAQLDAKRITLVVRPGIDGVVTDRLTVWADAAKLRQVLLNLLSNATKFTPAGGRVEVVCSAVDTDEGARALVRVIDSGIGIAEEKLDAVFEPFVQVDTSRTREHQGTGLGLAISRDLARGMGGDLSATSEPGVGSTFTLTLRRVTTERGERTDRRAREDRRAGDRRQRRDRRVE